MGLAGPKRIGLPLIILFASAMSASAVDLISCSHHKNTSPDAPKEYRTKTGKTIIISETHPVGRSLSTIRISTKGFEHNYAEVFENKDPISNVFIADLDGNGFDEIYVITRSVGSGSRQRTARVYSERRPRLRHRPRLPGGDRILRASPLQVQRQDRGRPGEVPRS